MPEQELQIHPEVDWDVIEISSYIEMDNSLASESVELAITQTYETLAQEPGIGTEYHPLRRTLKGIRMFPVPEYANYLIYYRPLPGNMGARILYVLHGARDAETFAKEHRRE